MEGDNSLKYISFNSVIDSSFWHKLYQLKLDEDRLEEKEREIRGFYLQPNSCSLIVDCTSFNREYESLLGKNQFTTIKYLCDKRLSYNTPFLSATGYLINFNSASKLKDSNKNLIIEKYGKLIKKDIDSGKAIENPNLLTKFVLITFANLKTFEFIYWFGFPALSSLSFKLLSKPEPLNSVFSEEQIDNLLVSHQELSNENKSVFALIRGSDKLKCMTMKEYIGLQNKSSMKGMYICFLDPSSDKDYPGWPLRNILTLLASKCKDIWPIDVICLRIGAPFETSIVLSVSIDEESKEDLWIGWEKNKRDKFGPRCVNLQNDLDPVRVADSSADLNLKLMKWRLVPDLDLDTIKSQKCLLLGAGTLGCSVARNLVAWGVRHVTFVDNGRVSFSNPVRQSLFSYGDCDLGSGGKMKAEAAAVALKSVLPTINSTGVTLEIPMPGHYSATIENAIKLHDLIEEHDVVFLLTDSRESRWLPTVICSVLQKLAITAALGYDTYLVMRHGQGKDANQKLGCYFCNDVTAPGNSMEDRTLDQQCTVTRPGVSNVASALTVELFMSILQHHEKGAAASTEETVLGILPHSIRGFISHFTHILPSTVSFSQCIACSSIVEKSYSENKAEFLDKVFKSTKYLEDLTGLTELFNATDSLQMLELNDEDGDDDDEENLESMEDLGEI
ncbi:ubiquitin-like modifier-activating enzyme ATG7 [Halyomorpha halys]|uniref:ubiquitin-like modifier-activating enzyme ATG7 n=1 Tax=Halyomorpha halys TaxID=286706 RepID=UPI0006D4D8AF|nr:ubiquitin-like modifier-activating enzyme ATG7 [Halyomorpha halys]